MEERENILLMLKYEKECEQFARAFTNLTSTLKHYKRAKGEDNLFKYVESDCIEAFLNSEDRFIVVVFNNKYRFLLEIEDKKGEEPNISFNSFSEEEEKKKAESAIIIYFQSKLDHYLKHHIIHTFVLYAFAYELNAYNTDFCKNMNRDFALMILANFPEFINFVHVKLEELALNEDKETYVEIIGSVDYPDGAPGVPSFIKDYRTEHPYDADEYRPFPFGI
ncbi:MULTISPECIES: hypothetical protein [Pseudomonas]|jgi:hypothetical protein|uniref:hypothetical protein n=1 Tax=Pseudomonas TaxID=286 RepID=UPI0015E3785C|nr:MULTISPECIES: hypothetical protein [Pseudomonas]MBA1300091.1 hypothetical protein [Pseudomonas carnis]MBJ2202971.1 hypothetical protein [Pseudomonas carnis]MBW9243992.1 hypothetical protein [Pseudomonas paracarnis]ULN82666.1 hypothetical protein HXW87_10930 [Pseudomonas sp. Y5-11]